MTSQEEMLLRLRRYNAKLRSVDDVADESVDMNLPPDQAIEVESIAMRKYRPVLAVQDGTTTLQFDDPEDIALWKPQLEKAEAKLRRAIAAVGRIDLKNNPNYSWVGTGWLLSRNVIVTNRHVAEAFATSNGQGFVFQAGVGGAMGAAVDFLQEIDRPGKRLFEVRRVLYIEPRPGIDLAFLEVDQTSGEPTDPIALSSKKPGAVPGVATIGYPAFDSRIPEPELMARIYGKVYDKKRLAPGAVTEVDDRNVYHNCTTLGGNSGSVVLDLETGDALGLHFSGSFMRTNYAVRADLVAEKLDALQRGTLRAPDEGRPVMARPAARAVSPRTSARGAGGGSGSSSFTIHVPLVVTVSLGDAQGSQAGGSVNLGGTVTAPAGFAEREDDDEDERDVETEARSKPEDYADRTGYVDDFLGDEMVVALPQVVKNKADVLAFGDGESVLKYEHFSVVYNKRRRMCFFSACNVDGARSKSSQRATWRFDPRIASNLQIMKECYGNAPRFSRGHMTRREDPAWGTARSIQRGSDDSMHVTNVTPQMQSFNSPIWLELEDYALKNARKDRQKISVFTGPYFTKNDPTMFGVRIPIKFWKVIAFVHDDTGELCATGYEMSQADNLQETEFVFGQFTSSHLNLATQVSIASIEARAGLAFDGLAELDPFGQESLVPSGPLTRIEQIKFF